MVIGTEYAIYAIAGAIGGFVAGLVRERGCIILPELRDRRVYLNSLAGIIMGSVSGIIGDATPINAFMWGLGGSVIVPSLVEAVTEQFRASCKGKDKQDR
jgi:hypothetical protein